MTKLLIIRDHITNFISRNETYIKPIVKFLLAMISLIMINSKIGYAEKLTNFAFTIILALLCSFLPANFIVLLCAGMMLLHLYSLSLASLIVVGGLLILMFLLYFRFSPKDTVLLLLTPVCFALKIPYVIPLSAGLVASTASAVSVGSGIIIYYILYFINTNASSLTGMDSESMLEQIRFLIDELLLNKEMLMFVIGFAVTILVVNIIRRLSVDHAWTYAIIAGSMCNIVVVLAGDLKFGTYISVAGLIFGSIFAIIAVTIIKFFIFNLDYKRTEKVQFEDDEYYYYVKAVPKNKAPKPGRKHKSNNNLNSNKNVNANNNQNSNKNVNATNTLNSDKNINTYNSLNGNKNINSSIVDRTGKKISDANQPVSGRKTDSNGMTGIERAAAAKARANRRKD